MRCVWGACRSDSRLPQRLDNVIFFPFVRAPPTKPWKTDQCQRWIKACGRPNDQLNVDKVNKGSYHICSLHFVDGRPTNLNPDPVQADVCNRRQIRGRKPMKKNATPCDVPRQQMAPQQESRPPEAIVPRLLFKNQNCPATQDDVIKKETDDSGIASVYLTNIFISIDTKNNNRHSNHTETDSASDDLEEGGYNTPARVEPAIDFEPDTKPCDFLAAPETVDASTKKCKLTSIIKNCQGSLVKQKEQSCQSQGAQTTWSSPLQQDHPQDTDRLTSQSTNYSSQEFLKYRTSSCQTEIIEDERILNDGNDLESVRLINESKSRKSTEYECLICEEHFTCLSLYNHHVKLMHPGELKCKFCDQIFNSLCACKTHIGTHGQCCFICKMKFELKCDWTYHMKTYHLNAKNTEGNNLIIQCSKCPHIFVNEHIVFKGKQSFKEHMKNHKNKEEREPIMCDVCGKLFESWGGFQTHRKSHASDQNLDKTLACDECKKMFANKFALKKHYTKDHMCKKCFKKSTNLTIHMRTHTKEKTFTCMQVPVWGWKCDACKLVPLLNNN